MPSFSFGGLASGLDTGAIIQQLVALESRPLQRLEAKRATLESRRSGFNDFRSKLSKLETTFRDLKAAKEIAKFRASSSDEQRVRVTADDRAEAGSYSVEVLNKAKAHTVAVTSPFADKDETAFGGGQIGFTVGTENHVVTIDADDTLVDIRDKINDGEVGVNASIIHDGTSYQLVLTAAEEGVANSFQAAYLGFPGAGGPMPTTLLEAPEDAVVKINGLTVTSATNEIDTAIEGVTLDIADEAPGEIVQVDIERDDDAIGDLFQDMIDAFNDVLGYIDSNKDSEDVSARGIRNSLLGTITSILPSGAGFGVRSLAEIGITQEAGGRLKLDRGDLVDALDADLEGVVALFTGQDGGPQGLAGLMNTVFRGDGSPGAAGILSGGNGTLALRQRSINDRIRALDDQIVRAEERLLKFEERETKRFASFEQLTSQFQAQGAYLGTSLAR